MEPVTNWGIALHVDDVLLGEGMNPQIAHTKRPALVAAAERALGLGPDLLRPGALVSHVRVHELRHERLTVEGGVLTGPLVSRHLAGAEWVAAAICTIGPDLETEVARLFAQDPVLALALDGFGNAAVVRLEQQVCNWIGSGAETSGLTASTPISPGAPDWPVEVGQPQIFALVNAAAAGIQITPGGMMIPKKSVSFVVGIGKDMSQPDQCELCSLKEVCRYHHV